MRRRERSNDMHLFLLLVDCAVERLRFLNVLSIPSLQFCGLWQDDDLDPPILNCMSFSCAVHHYE